MPTCVRGKCVVVRSVNRRYGTVHRRTLMHVDLRLRKLPYHPSMCRICRRTAPYARLTQGTQGPKQASNLTHVDHATHSSHVTDHFLSTLLSLSHMHCVACCWKSRLTPAVLCWKARPLGTAAVPPAALRRASPQRIQAERTCRSYRIAIFCLISYRIYRFLLWLYRTITTYVC